MANFERPERHRNPLDVQREERERLREVTEAQSRAIEALRQRNIALRDQLRGAVAVDDAAVERAARVLFADYTAQYETTWERDGEAFMDQARRVLDALGGGRT